MHDVPTDDRIRDLWKKLWLLRCRLDEQIFTDADETDFSNTLMLEAEVSLRLKALVQKRSSDDEVLLAHLRDEADIDPFT